MVNESSRTSAHWEPRISDAVQKMAASGCPILVIGERGVGKAWVAELLHELSPRRAHPQKRVQGAALSRSRVAGLLSDPGTLVITEVTDMSPQVQEEVVRRYNHMRVESRSRLICTTSCDLEEAMREGRLREDFYYLVSAVSLRIPPLRHRRDELITVAEGMLDQFARQYDRPKPVLNAELRSFLLKHPWPGNLAELESSMKTCVVIGDPEYSLAALRAALPKRPSRGGATGPVCLKTATRAACIRVERQIIAATLQATDGNRKQTAKALKISYKTLLYKLKQNGLADASAIALEGAHS